ncbi:dihydrolipoyl dehydrogenase [Gordonia sp. TBRC 11910]|uniref:Dihydrolipoyl dehydrogenase n=1 Tax=Gordonia asplenii TaxID=2725283 RepID=A0A848KY16_9ACTN|nr:dihydrolipoyl dehydrogenase [Gordonia asplenii]NMO03550.1 dihydrolipoyl dehydrogenase [Gordonia asplenii]
METDQSDVLILGGGSAGYACALRAAQLDKSVTLIEARKVGGTCLHNGCIPTKAILHAAEIADMTRAGTRFGVRSVFDGVDIESLHEYRDGTIDKLYTGLRGLLAQRGVRTVEGFGTFVGDRTIVVDGRRYTGDSVVLASGSRSRTLPGFDAGPRILTSAEALTLNHIPDSVIVLGGGVIGVEFASAWRSFDAQVTIVEALPRLVAGEDNWASTQLERALRRRGISVRTSTPVSAAAETDDGVRITLSDGSFLSADVLLVAVGREPRTDESGYAENGIVLDRGFVVTDDHLRTNLSDVYAAGDIVAGPQLAHRGFAHGIFIAEHIAGLSPIPVADHLIPRITYSHPEVASVGYSEESARERFGDVESIVYDLAGNGRSRILGTSGGVKVVRAVGGPVLGVHMVGDRVGELIGEAQLTVAWEALPSDVAPFVHAHPTQNEALGEAMLALAGKGLHVHE